MSLYWGRSRRGYPQFPSSGSILPFGPNAAGQFKYRAQYRSCFFIAY
jgi:hypothetical protein